MDNTSTSPASAPATSGAADSTQPTDPSIQGATPDASATTTPSDSTGASDTSASASGTPAAQAAPGDSGQPATPGQPNAQSQQQPGQKPAQPTPDQVQQQVQQQQVQKAGHMYTVMQALAGGPQYKTTVNPDTGATTRTQVPMSKTQIGMVLALEAVTGALSGLSQTGPGAIGKAGVAGIQQGDQIAQQRQQAQQEQDKQAQEDAKSQQQALVAHAQTYEANSRRILNTAQSERYGVDSLKDTVESNSQLLSDYQDNNAVQESHVAQDTLQSRIASKELDPTKVIAIPDGFTNLNGKYEQTFSLVSNPRAKVPMTQEQYDQFADDGTLGFHKGVKIPAGYEVPGTIIANANAQHEALGLMKQDVSAVTDTLSKSDDKANQALAKTIPDLDKQLDDPNNGPTLRRALVSMQSYVSHSDMHKMDFFQSLQQMAAPSKPNPMNPKQSIPNKDAGAAQMIAGAFGNGDPQKGWDVLQAYHNELTTQAEEVKKKADEAVAVDQAKQIAEATEPIKQRAAYGDAAARTQAEIDTKKKNGVPLSGGKGGDESPSHPELNSFDDPKYVGDDGINHAYLEGMRKLDPRRAGLLEVVGEGKADPSSYIFAKEYGANAMGDVHIAFPDWDQTASHGYMKLRENFTSGKDHTIIRGINTTLIHAADAYGNTGWLAQNSPSKFSSDAVRYNDDIDRLTEGVNSAYTSGVLDVKERDRILDGLKSPRPAVAQTSIQELVHLLADAQVDSLYQSWQNGKPSSIIPDFPIVTPQGANAYKSVMGHAIDSKYLGQKTRLQQGSSGHNTSVSQPGHTQIPVGAMSTGKGTDGNDYYLDKNNHPLGRVPTSTPGPQSSVQPHPLAGYSYLSPDGQHGWNGQQWVPVAGAQGTAA